MYKLIIENPELRKQTNKVISRSQAIQHNHSPQLFMELEELFKKANLWYFIVINDDKYTPCKIEEDLALSLKCASFKNNQAVQDIRAYSDVQTISSQHNGFISQENMDIARRKIWRAENENNIEGSGFDLYPEQSGCEKIILLFLSYRQYVSRFPSRDSAHNLGQIILNQELALEMGPMGWSITQAIKENLAEYELHMQDFGYKFYVEKLTEYVTFMLKISLECIERGEKMLKVGKIYEDIQKYIAIQNNEVFSLDNILLYGELLIKELLIVGEVAQNDVSTIIRRQKSTAIILILQLKQYGIIRLDTPKGKIRISFEFMNRDCKIREC